MCHTAVLMSFRQQLKLPSLKVTHRSPSVNATFHVVKRGAVGSGPIKSIDTTPNCDFQLPNPELQDVIEPQDLHSQDSQISLYSIKQRSTVTAWDSVRDVLLQCVVEGFSMPNQQLCMVCSSLADARCIQCGPHMYYCSKCCITAHSKVNLFHTPELWQDGVFKPFSLTKRVIDVLFTHDCVARQHIQLLCVADDGTEHHINFVTCSCEPLTTTLVRAKLWPGTPKNPRIVFSFNFLDWVEALMLECHVALKDLCKAVHQKIHSHIYKQKDIYQNLIDCFEEYRYMKHQLATLNFLNNKLDCGNICPACPEQDSSGPVVISMDALFGLPRKTNAGKSYRPPLFGDTMFMDQHVVDEFVAAESTRKHQIKACNAFLAGDSIRSANRFKALDETAVFGCACRHEHPLLFNNLKHGERLSYSVVTLDKLIERYSSELRLFLLYDVACSLEKYLQSHGRGDILSRVTLAIPVFHAYGHRPECQVIYGPLRCEGIGLSDGEVMERLWSYLRRFSRMTKEMRPSHRVDVLTSALLYYCQQARMRFFRLVMQRWRHAQEVLKEAETTLMMLLSKYNIERKDIEDLMLRENEMLKKQESHKKSPVNGNKEHEYFLTLQTLFQTREHSCGKDVEKVHGDICLLNQKLELLEADCGITKRWDPTHPKYIEYVRSQASEALEHSKSSLRSCVAKRQFLLKLKAKYADGHKIAQKLSKQINQQTKQLHSALDRYNMASSVLNPSSSPVPFSAVLSLDAPFWKSSTSLSCFGNTIITSDTRQEVIQNYLLSKRSNEELKLLRQDVNCTLEYYNRKRKLLSESINELQCSTTVSMSSAYHSGCLCLLKQQMTQVECLASKATETLCVLKEQTTAMITEQYDSDSDFDDSLTSDSDNEI